MLTIQVTSEEENKNTNWLFCARTSSIVPCKIVNNLLEFFFNADKKKMRMLVVNKSLNYLNCDHFSNDTNMMEKEKQKQKMQKKKMIKKTIEIITTNNL